MMPFCLCSWAATVAGLHQVKVGLGEWTTTNE